MNAEDEFREKCGAFFQFIDGVEALENTVGTPAMPTYLSALSIATNRAATFVVFYNIVEASFNSAFREMRRSVYRDRRSLKSFKSAWRKDVLGATLNDKLRQGTKYTNIISDVDMMITHEKQKRKEWLERDAFPFSGNLNQERLIRWCTEIGLSPPTPKISRGGGFLNTVCRHRNELAHGRETFHDIGNIYTIAELRANFLRTRCFLKLLLREMLAYAKARRHRE